MKRKTFVTTLLAAAVLIVSGVMIMVPFVREYKAQQHRTQQAQMRPYGPDGRDIAHAGQTLDQMYAILVARELQDRRECSRLGLSWDEEKARRKAIADAATAEIRRVSDSNYTIPFNEGVIDEALAKMNARRSH